MIVDRLGLSRWAGIFCAYLAHSVSHEPRAADAGKLLFNWLCGARGAQERICFSKNEKSVELFLSLGQVGQLLGSASIHSLGRKILCLKV